MTRIGLIGAGRWGRNAARAMAKAGVLAWVADADPYAASSLAAEHGVSFVHMDGHFGIGGNLFPWDEVTGCWLATPIETHELLVHAALSAGKHVLCEKPLSRSKAQAAELAADAERRGLVLMCDFTWLGHAGVMALTNSDCSTYVAQRWAKDDRGFDAIEDLMPHDLVLAERLFGCDARAVSVDAEGIWVKFGDIGFSGIQLASLSYRYDSDEKRRRVRIGHNENNGELPEGAPEPLSVILDEFISAIREHRQPRIGGAAEFVHVAAVIEAAKASRAKGGEWVDVQ